MRRISATLSTLLLAALAVSASAASSAPPPEAFNPRSGNPYWLRIYSTAPYKEFWTGELTLKRYARGLPKVIAAIKDAHGELVAPVAEQVGSRRHQVQQLSFSLSKRSAERLLKRLRRLGRLPAPAVRRAGAPIPLDEVNEKIRLLTAEKSANAAALAKMPAISAATEEILDHLLMVREVAERTDAEVRFDLVVKAR
ncbi:MAG: hypothetical protein KGM24_14770 [Elusimicrobia bacterium]|nr:hypothetical protein [Elusimicrobiota bacterium]